MNALHVGTKALLFLGLVVTWAVTFFTTLYMAIFHVPLSLLQFVSLVVSAPTKCGWRQGGQLFVLWIFVMTANQCIALAWLLAYYGLIKDWAYSTSFSLGDAISSVYFSFSVVASCLLIYRFRRQLCGVLA